MKIFLGNYINLTAASDIINQDNDLFQIPLENLTQETPNGFPPHTLRLRLGK